MTLRAVDLCCGAGGWAVAARGLPIDWVAVADIDRDSIETWEVNHLAEQPDCRRLLGDLSTDVGQQAVLEAAGAGGVDLVVGGIPCEQISVARGHVKPTSDVMADWHRLIDAMFALVARWDPRWWCFEDVVQVKRHLPLAIDHGRQIRVRTIDARGYGPQGRVRAYVGEFPDPAPYADPSEPRSLQFCLRPGPHLAIRRAEEYKALYAWQGSGSLSQDKLRIIRPEDPCPTILSTTGSPRGGRQGRQFTIVDGRGKRRLLSWQEAALVQGFPDDYLFVGSFGGAARMVGRAIPIQVGRAILRAICAAASGDEDVGRSVGESGESMPLVEAGPQSGDDGC